MLNRDLSDAINRLRMPLAFLVVCVHADFTKNFLTQASKLIVHTISVIILLILSLTLWQI